MKKILVSLLVLAMVAPAMAVVTIDTVDNTNGTMTITMDTGGDVVRGVALLVTCTNGASLVNLSYDANAEFNTFIDFLSVNSGTIFAGDTPNPASDSPTPHPYAAAGTTAGEAVAGATTFVVSMGVLDETSNQLGYNGSGDLITINTGAGDVCVSLDTVRGGIVGDVALTTSIDTTPDCVLVTDGPAECFPACHPDYTQWLAVGKPDSWCYPSQCYGDADGLTETIGHGTYTVADNDLAVLVAGYRNGSYVDPATTPWIAADFDHASETIGHGTYRVADNDLAVLVTYYRAGSVPADCLTCP